MRPGTLFPLIAGTASLVADSKRGDVCEVPAHEDGSDDSAAILDAFDDCGHGGTIIFSNTTYHVEKVLNTTGLEDCRIELKGTLLVRYSEAKPQHNQVCDY